MSDGVDHEAFADGYAAGVAGVQNPKEIDPRGRFSVDYWIGWRRGLLDRGLPVTPEAEDLIARHCK